MALLSEIQKRQYSWNKLIIRRINWKYLKEFLILIWVGKRLTWMAGISKTWIKWWSSLNTHRRPKYDITTSNYVKNNWSFNHSGDYFIFMPFVVFYQRILCTIGCTKILGETVSCRNICSFFCAKNREKEDIFFFHELKPIYKPLRSWAKPLKPFSLMWFYIPTFMLPPKSHFLKCLLRENNVI